MEIRPEEVKGKSQIGWLGQDPIYLIELIGGYTIVAVVRHGRAEPLGLGPHPGIAKGLAWKRERSIRWDTLEKSMGAFDPEGRLALRYQRLTDALRRLQGF